jgi:hypothetical protein
MLPDGCQKAAHRCTLRRFIYGQPRLRKGQLMPTGRLPAVIYPVSIDPDGFRGTTPNHLTLSKTSDVFVGLGHPSVRNRSAITSIAFADR